MSLSRIVFISLLAVFGLFHARAEEESLPSKNFPLLSQSPDFAETAPDEKTSGVAEPQEPLPLPALAGAIAPASLQPTGALSGRIIFTSGGHGWTWSGSSWVTQRGITWEMLEDYGNLDQMNFFVFYCFNAGATVVPMRPVGFQTNEVVLDNDDAGVTFAGFWTNSTSTIFYGSAGDVPYRYAALNGTETATATYTPNIPKTGFYPVYTWVRAGSDRGDQLYRVRHTGGESQVRVPHYMVGNGWVYLGTYYFDAGSNAASGAVVISNLRSTTNGVYTFADAIRFGNGMGSINRGGGVSGYPREDECSRYWVQSSLGQGQSSSIYDGSGDDQSDNVGTPPRMAAEMNREASGNMYKRLFVGFHSNACGCGANPTARGDVGLYNDPTLSTNVEANSNTLNQKRLAEIVATNVNNTLKQITVPTFEVGWTNNRSSLIYARSDYAFGEINNNYINNEFDAIILEVAFHDNFYDALLLRDSKVRNWIARATCQGVVRYMNQFDTVNPVPLNFLPEPPSNVRAIAVSNGIAVSWNVPVAEFSTGPPASYVVYQSTNGYGFGNPTNLSGSGTTSFTFTNLPTDMDFYFRVAAVNAGGESFPSETVGCRRASNPSQPRVLCVNAFDRFDRTTNLRMTAVAQSYSPPDSSGTTDRVIPRSVNSFDYVVQHGKSISAFGLPFDSCQRRAVTNNTVALTNYPIVVWAAGQSLTNTFRALEQNAVTTFLNRGGNLFISGADIAYDLDRASGPSAADRAFLKNQLHADLTSDANTNSGSYAFAAAVGSIFNGNSNGAIDNGNSGIYWVQTPDVIAPFGGGAIASVNYTGNANGAAAIQYDGSAGGGKVVYFGFPFETITSAARRDQYMADVLTFLTPTAPTIGLQPQNLAVVQGSNATFTVAATGGITLTYQWQFNGTNLFGATTNSFTRSNANTNDAGNYSVIVTNMFGSVTSSVATLSVIIPPTITTQPQSQVVWTGSNVTFFVTATGDPLNYQWRFNGTNISAATTESFTRYNAQTNDSGNYSVIVSNAGAVALSLTAKLTVVDAPPSFQLLGLLPGNQIKLVLTGVSGNYLIESSSNLVNWTALTNLAKTNSTLEFIDGSAATAPQRFYRALIVP